MSATPPAEPTPSIRLPGSDEVTLLEGSSFCRSTRTGDIDPHAAQGLFVKDTRLVSSWELTLDNEPLTSLGVLTRAPYAATFVTRAAARAGCPEPTVVIERHRMIADGLREDVLVRNFSHETLDGTLELGIGSDFADLFAVKDGRPATPGPVRRRSNGEDLELSVHHEGQRRGVRVRGHGGQAARDRIRWQLSVPPHGEWQTSIEVLPSAGGEETPAAFPVGAPVETASPARRRRDWRAAAPTVRCANPILQTALDRSVDDLGSLRITDPAHPDLDVIAAGAPWFMALFGRDSLITSWLALPFDLSLARGSLHTLARLQGRRVDPLSEEQPGRILHEVRLGIDETRALGGGSVYYGSIDATPLFVMLLGEAARWGLPAADLAALLPAADRALDWIEGYGDLDGDGFVEYQRATDRGLLNQGWKDSLDAITFADGRPAQPPIALAEVQAYVYGAYQARADLATRAGDPATAQRMRQRADTLRARFDDAFWLPERGHYALALDAAKQPVDALASNQGHCLWTGIARPDRIDAALEHLTSPAMFTGWGVRTLAATMAAFNPISYHNGSVWPHDNAILVQGLARYGRFDAAARIAAALIEASAPFAGRLPELFCGFDRADVPVPLPYPTSCSPQAWAAATPIGLLTALLTLDPDATNGTVTAARQLPAEWGDLTLTGINVGGHRIDLDTRHLPARQPAAHLLTPDNAKGS